MPFQPIAGQWPCLTVVGVAWPLVPAPPAAPLPRRSELETFRYSHRHGLATMVRWSVPAFLLRTPGGAPTALGERSLRPCHTSKPNSCDADGQPSGRRLSPNKVGWVSLHRESWRRGHRHLASRCGARAAQAEDCSKLGSRSAPKPASSAGWQVRA